jgi:hypothetical protein
MNRVLFARGARGELIKKIQRGLAFDQSDVDGIYGSQTEGGVKEFQVKHALEPTGAIDSDSWGGITHLPLPELFERALGITADFEGHGFEIAIGNFDGAGITWGIIGFTLLHGEISTIVLDVHEVRPDLLEFAFGDLTPDLLQIMNAPVAQQIEFADLISIGPKKIKLSEPWLSSFATFGRLAEVQEVQLRRAREKYFEPAHKAARRLGLGTELGLALCFDIQVQNGGIKKAIETELRQQKFSTEKDLRVALANAVADSSRPKFREDVRSRKMTLAIGTGKVHGARFHIPSWGLDELPLA